MNTIMYYGGEASPKVSVNVAMSSDGGGELEKSQVPSWQQTGKAYILWCVHPGTGYV